MLLSLHFILAAICFRANLNYGSATANNTLHSVFLLTS